MLSKDSQSEDDCASIFIGACIDTRTAWQKTNISSMVKKENIDSLRSAMSVGDACAISGFLMNMANNPYSNIALGSLFNDAKALKLSGLFLQAFSEPYVESRKDGELLDIVGLRDSIPDWIRTGRLPPGARENSDIGKITKLVNHAEQRVVLTACFASPIEFSVLALSLEG